MDKKDAERLEQSANKLSNTADNIVNGLSKKAIDTPRRADSFVNVQLNVSNKATITGNKEDKTAHSRTVNRKDAVMALHATYRKDSDTSKSIHVKVSDDRMHSLKAKIQNANNTGDKFVVHNAGGTSELRSGAYNKMNMDMTEIANATVETAKSTVSQSDAAQGMREMRRVADMMGTSTRSKKALVGDIKYKLNKTAPSQVTKNQLSKSIGKEYKDVTSLKDYEKNMQAIDNALRKSGLGGSSGYSKRNIDKMLSQGYAMGTIDRMRSHMKPEEKYGVRLTAEQRTLLKEKRRLLQVKPKVNQARNMRGGHGGVAGVWMKEATRESDVYQGYRTAKGFYTGAKGLYKGTKALGGLTGVAGTNMAKGAIKGGLKVAEGGMALGAKMQKVSIKNDSAKMQKWKVNQDKRKEKFKIMQQGVSKKANIVQNGIVSASQKNSIQIIGNAAGKAIGKTKFGKSIGDKKQLLKNRFMNSKFGKGLTAAGKMKKSVGKTVNKILTPVRMPMRIVNKFKGMIMKAGMALGGFFLTLLFIDIVVLCITLIISNPFAFIFGWGDDEAEDDLGTEVTQNCIDNIYTKQIGVLQYIETGETNWNLINLIFAPDSLVDIPETAKTARNDALTAQSTYYEAYQARAEAKAKKKAEAAKKEDNKKTDSENSAEEYEVELEEETGDVGETGTCAVTIFADYVFTGGDDTILHAPASLGTWQKAIVSAVGAATVDSDGDDDSEEDDDEDSIEEEEYDGISNETSAEFCLDVYEEMLNTAQCTIECSKEINYEDTENYGLEDEEGIAIFVHVNIDTSLSAAIEAAARVCADNSKYQEYWDDADGDGEYEASDVDMGLAEAMYKNTTQEDEYGLHYYDMNYTGGTGGASIAEMTAISAASGEVAKDLNSCANWYITNVRRYSQTTYFKCSGDPLGSARADCSGFACFYMRYVANTSQIPTSCSGNMYPLTGAFAINAEKYGWKAYPASSIGSVSNLCTGDVMVCDGHVEIFVSPTQSFGWGSAKTHYPSSRVWGYSAVSKSFYEPYHSNYVTVYRYIGTEKDRKKAKQEKESKETKSGDSKKQDDSKSKEKSGNSKKQEDSKSKEKTSGKK